MVLQTESKGGALLMAGRLCVLFVVLTKKTLLYSTALHKAVTDTRGDKTVDCGEDHCVFYSKTHCVKEWLYPNTRDCLGGK